MNKFIYLFLITVIIFLPKTTHAAWYWLTIPDNAAIGEFRELSAIDYAVTSIPKYQFYIVPDSLVEMWNTIKDSKSCVNEYNSEIEQMREFDASHELFAINYGKEPEDDETVPNEVTSSERDDLFVSFEKNAQSCLTNEQQMQEVEAKKEADKKRLDNIQIALENCDFDFFDNDMTSDERMNTYNEREACKIKSERISTTSTVQSPTVTPIPPITLPIISVPAKNHPTPISVKPLSIEKQTPHLEIAASTTEAETFNSTSTLTATSESIQQPQPTTSQQSADQNILISKDSFIGKIINFFSKLKFW